MPRIIEVTVSPTGESVVQTKGFAGSDCQQASKYIEDALGIATGERKTPEFFAVSEHERQQINQ
jgi:Protein of unknown function (DUF2997)